jgi:hypothetical protein
MNRPPGGLLSERPTGLLSERRAQNAKMSEAETVAGDVASYANTLEPDRKNTSLSSQGQ